MTTPPDPIPQPELKSTPPPKDEHPDIPPHPGRGMGDDLFYAPALRNDGEEFPVLKAFQSYLEEERERARRRVVTVSVAALVAVVLIVVAFLVIVTNLMRRNDQLFAAVLTQATNPANVVVAPPAAPSQPAAPEPKPESAEEAKLREKLEHLERANAALSDRLDGLQALPDALAERMAVAMSNAVASAVAVETSSPAAIPAPPPAAVPPPPPAEAPTAQPKPTVRVSRPRPASKPAPPKAQADAPTEGAAQPISAEEPTVVADGRGAEPQDWKPDPAPDNDVKTIEVKRRPDAKPMVDGFHSATVRLSTDSGVRIPWRIAEEN